MYVNLEKRSYEKKAITHDQLKAIEGEIVWDINDQTGNFYKAFLTSNSSPEEHIIDKQFDLLRLN